MPRKSNKPKYKLTYVDEYGERGTIGYFKTLEGAQIRAENEIIPQYERQFFIEKVKRKK